MNIHRSAHVYNTRREQRKEATTRSGATAPTERHCADKARHTKREQDKISIQRGSQNIPPDWESPQDTLETLLISSTENCVSKCYPHGTPWQQQGDKEPKEKQNTPKRVETRFKTRQLQHNRNGARADANIHKAFAYKYLSNNFCTVVEEWTHGYFCLRYFSSSTHFDLVIRLAQKAWRLQCVLVFLHDLGSRDSRLIPVDSLPLLLIQLSRA